MKNKEGLLFLNKMYKFYYIYLQNIRILDLVSYRRALGYFAQSNYKLAIQFFNKMSSLDNPNACFKMGMCYFKQKNWAEAEYYFSKAIANPIYKETWLVQLYQSRVKVNQSYATDNQKIEYLTNEAVDGNNLEDEIVSEAKNLILNKNYHLAITLLEKQVFLYPLNSELWFLLGCIYDDFRSYEKSIEYFKNSYELAKSSRNYKYRYAYALEKNGNLAQANKLYSEIISDSDDDVACFGIGILHAKRGLWSDAIESFSNYTDTDPEINIHLYQAYFYSLDYDNAASCLRKYVDISTKIKPDNYYKLAKTYLLNDRYEDALHYYNKYIDRAENLTREEYDEYVKSLTVTNNLQNPSVNYNLNIFPVLDGVVKSGSFLKSNQEKFWNKYIYYNENFSIRENIYFFESFAGATISCNPYAILLELLKRRDETHTYVVVCNDDKKIPANLYGYKNIIFVKKNSNLYIRYLATAKYLINNTTFSPYFYKREEQIYLMTWHGTPIKSLGRDQKNGFMSHANVTRNFLHATHIISPNPHTTHVFLNRYDIKDLYQGEFYEIGYPRVDLTLAQGELTKEQLGVESSTKIVLYAPTWRGGEKLEGEVDVDQLIADLESMADIPGITLFYKSHHLIEEVLKNTNIPVRLVPENIDINQFLSVVDCLISDYSSIIFDYLPLNKPIVSYVYDYEKYIQDRGELYFSKDKLFGFVCNELQEVKDILNQVSVGKISVNYQTQIEEFCPYDDQTSSAKIVDILHGTSSYAPLKIEQKPVNLFFCGSFLPNGVTNSFKNLIQEISKIDDCKFALVFDINAVQSKVDNYDSFQDIIDLPIILLGRLGATMNTADEKWLKAKLEVQNDFFNDKTREIIFDSYRREQKRIFGHAQFKNVINFDGYSIFWIILFSLFEQSRKIIYLHSDMYGEWKARFPYLKSVFSMYEFYDVLNSVSEACYRENTLSLKVHLGLETKQNFANNAIDYQKILTLAERKVEVDSKQIKDFNDFKGTKFINVARLSVEKDQDKLIRAFDLFLSHTNTDAKLYIVGYGPLEDKLRELISSLKLDERVILLGYQSNPYYFMKHSDLFVFSSNYEGQGLVLLESMILDLPIVTTDIEGVQSVIKGTNVLSVENSIEGLCQGMNQFMQGEVKSTDFNYVEYNNLAIEQFKKLIEI